MNNYCIKEELEENRSTSKQFWTNEKIKKRDDESHYDVYKLCRKIIKKKEVKSVLDIGCGIGIKLMKLIEPVCENIYGIDQELSINYARQKYGQKNFFIDNIEDPELKLKQKFDLIICSDVIEHLKNPDKLINYIKKYSDKNSLIVISTPERDILRGKNIRQISHWSHVREWNRIELYRYLKNHNLNVIYHIVIGSFKIFVDFKLPIKFFKKKVLNRLRTINHFKWKRYKHTQFVLCSLKGFKLSNRFRKDLKNIFIYHSIKDPFLKIMIFFLNFFYKIWKMVRKLEF